MKEEDELEKTTELSVSELKELAKAKGIKGYSKMTKEELEKVIEEN